MPFEDHREIPEASGTYTTIDDDNEDRVKQVSKRPYESMKKGASAVGELMHRKWASSMKKRMRAGLQCEIQHRRCAIQKSTIVRLLKERRTNAFGKGRKVVPAAHLRM